MATGVADMGGATSPRTAGRPATSLVGSQRRHAVALTVVSLVGLIMTAAFQPDLQALPLRPFAISLLFVVVLLGVLIRGAEERKALSLAFILYATLCVFHLGLYVRPAVTGAMAPSLSQTVYSDQWYSGVSLVRAGVVVALGFFGFGLGVGLKCWHASRRGRRTSPAPHSEESNCFARAISDIGSLTLLLGVAVWWARSASALGPDFFLKGYTTFLRATSGSAIIASYVLVSLGVTLSVVGRRNKLSNLALLAFVAFALPAFVVGLRGEVLIPAAAAMAVFATQPGNQSLLDRLKRPTARLLTVAAVLVLLAGISLVQQIRLSGLGSYAASGQNASASPLGAIEEMGFTVRVVVVSLEWHEDLHEPYAQGQTYTGQVERAYERIAGLPRPAAADDYRLFNSEIAQRVGPVGGSVIAEADHNFGRPGVALVLGALGVLTAGPRLDRRRVSIEAARGILGLLALMHVRNSFAPLFTWACIGFGLIAVAWLLSKAYPRRRTAGANR